MLGMTQKPLGWDSDVGIDVRHPRGAETNIDGVRVDGCDVGKSHKNLHLELQQQLTTHRPPDRQAAEVFDT